jgi:predicted MFS family arabinose efflux permease
MSTPPPPAGAAPLFTPYQKFVVAVLTFLQFTVVLDFMIMSPLGALLTKSLQIPAPRFGLVMSVYALSAGISGILAAAFADRFDRKKLLLFFYAGFLIGNVLCGIANSYHFLLVARVITGLFGGVIASIALAIITDLFAPQVRGRVMGVVQTAFSASQALGIPLGLIISNRWGWHGPFLLIAAVSTAVGVVIALKLQPIDAHLRLQREKSPLLHLFRTVSRADYLRAFGCTTVLATGGFMLMPFASIFLDRNLGIPVTQLWKIYLVTGLVTVVTGPLIGRLSDRVGKYTVFCAGTALTMVMVLIYTHLGLTPLVAVMAVNVLLFIGVTTRIISASALMTAVPEPASRGAFMSVNSAVQQLSGALAAAAAGFIIVQPAQGPLQHYDTLGYVVLVAMVVCMAMLYPIYRAVSARAATTAPIPVRVRT